MSTHAWTIWDGYDGGGKFREWYTDDDGGSGYGDHAMTHRWYGDNPPDEPDPSQWHPTSIDDGPDPHDAAMERRFD